MNVKLSVVVSQILGNVKLDMKFYRTRDIITFDCSLDSLNLYRVNKIIDLAFTKSL